MPKSSKNLRRVTVKKDPHITAVIAEVARLSASSGLLAAQMREISLVQLKVAGESQDARTYMGEAVVVMQEVLDEFDARIKVIEQKLGIPTEAILDNEEENP